MLRLIAGGDLQALEHHARMDAEAQSESFCIQPSMSSMSAASCHSVALPVTVLIHKNSSVRIPTHTIITVCHTYTPVQLQSALDSCEVMGSLSALPQPLPMRTILGESNNSCTHLYLYCFCIQSPDLADPFPVQPSFLLQALGIKCTSL